MLQTEPITRLKFSQQIPLYGKPLVYRSKQYSHANCHGYMKVLKSHVNEALLCKTLGALSCQTHAHTEVLLIVISTTYWVRKLSIGE